MGTVNSLEITGRDIHLRIQAFLIKHQSDGYGIVPGYEFAHIVLDDYNLDDSFIQYCLDRADTWEQEQVLEMAYFGMFEDVKRVTRAYKEDACTLLNWLLTVPDDMRVDAEAIDHGEWIVEHEQNPHR